MACRGVHFALSPEDAALLLGCSSDQALLEVIQSDIEERYFASQEWCYETDKAWDAIHRCLAAGYLIPDDGPYPGSLAILGGKQLYGGDDYVVSLVPAEKLQATAEHLAGITETMLRDRYFSLDETDYEECMSEEDFKYTLEYFSGLPEFFKRAAEAGRTVIFTVDQ